MLVLCALQWAFSLCAWSQTHSLSTAEKTQLVGGQVWDERGKPIAGVEVIVCETGHYEVSDASGRWSHRISAGQLHNVLFRLVHPEFASATLACKISEPNAQASAFASEQALLDCKAIVLMKRGIPLGGVVLDASGKPIEGAKITGEDFILWSTADGHFKLKNANEGPLNFLVQANGFAPVYQSISVSAGLAPVEIRLVKSPGLRFHLLDSKSRPIPGAEISVKKWEGTTSTVWRWKTDAAGNAIWSSAPTNDVEFEITHRDFEVLPSLTLKADGQEHTLTLRRKTHVLGTVVCASTGQSISSFRIIPGISHENHYDWDWTNVVAGRDGSFDIPLPKRTAPCALRIEADGFYPEISATFAPEEEEPRVDVTLKPGEKIAGVVKFPDGRPVSAAEVILCTESETVVMGAEKFLQGYPGQVHMTDEEGRFEFPPEASVRFIAAVNAQGYGECSFSEFQKSKLIQLNPWGQISGLLQVGNRPGSNQLVQLARLGSFEPRFLVNGFTALADPEGRFLFEKVPPGEFLIGRFMNSKFSHGQPVHVAPGKTTVANLGKISDRSLTVRIVAADGRELDWENTRQPAVLHAKMPPLAVPPITNALARQLWLLNYWDSPEGRARDIANVPYVMQYQSNNVFSVENVPAGDYECEIHYHEATGDASDQCIGIVTNSVRIPAMGKGAVNDPVDLGTLILQIKPNKEGE